MQVMCAYKLVTVHFKWFGLQSIVENFAHKVHNTHNTHTHTYTYTPRRTTPGCSPSSTARCSAGWTTGTA